MIAILWVILGLVVGGVGGVFGYRYATGQHRKIDDEATVKGVKWEKHNKSAVFPALKHLRRHYPTHEIVTGVSFLDLATPRGASVGKAIECSKHWRVGLVMVDKRTAQITKILLLADEAEIEIKSWILKRVGYKVSVIDADTPEADLLDKMAA